MSSALFSPLEYPEAEVIFWVGCAPSFDERAKKVARATAQLMQKAGVGCAIAILLTGVRTCVTYW